MKIVFILENLGMGDIKGLFEKVQEVISKESQEKLTKNLAKGIKVEATEKNAKIDVNIIVEYGSRIPDVAFEIQNRVKKTVESMTGLKVEEVNVHVQGVKTEKDDDEEERENAVDNVLLWD